MINCNLSVDVLPDYFIWQVLLRAKKLQAFLLVPHWYRYELLSDHEVPLGICIPKGISMV